MSDTTADVAAQIEHLQVQIAELQARITHIEGSIDFHTEPAAPEPAAPTE